MVMQLGLLICWDTLEDLQTKLLGRQFQQVCFLIFWHMKRIVFSSNVAVECFKIHLTFSKMTSMTIWHLWCLAILILLFLSLIEDYFKKQFFLINRSLKQKGLEIYPKKMFYHKKNAFIILLMQCDHFCGRSVGGMVGSI